VRVQIHSLEAIACLPMSFQGGRDGIDVHQHGIVRSPAVPITSAAVRQPVARPVGEARPEPAR